MLSPESLGRFTVFYGAVFVASLFGLPYLGLKGPRPSLLIASAIILVFSVAAPRPASELRFLLTLITVVAGLGIAGGVLALLFRKDEPPERAADANFDAEATVPCPHCGRVNSMHTRICPHCEKRV